MSSEDTTGCLKCLRIFDQSDLRFDGTSQYPGTPWCSRCVDRCHEATEFDHSCTVCASVPGSSGEVQG